VGPKAGLERDKIYWPPPGFDARTVTLPPGKYVPVPSDSKAVWIHSRYVLLWKTKKKSFVLAGTRKKTPVP
jgi:hypothetical protein